MNERAPLRTTDRVGLARHVRLQWEDAQQAWVVLYPKGNVRLNASAGEILKLCTGDKTVSAIVSELQREFPDHDLSKDVYRFLEVACGKGWIETKHPR